MPQVGKKSERRPMHQRLHRISYYPAASCTLSLSFSLSFSPFLRPFLRVSQSPPALSMRAVLRSQPSWPVQHCVPACTSSKLVKRPLCRSHYPRTASAAAFPDRRVLETALNSTLQDCACVTGCNTAGDRASIFVTFLMNVERVVFRFDTAFFCQLNDWYVRCILEQHGLQQSAFSCMPNFFLKNFWLYLFCISFIKSLQQYCVEKETG